MDERQDHIEAELVSMRRRIRRLMATNVVLGVVVLAFGGTSAAYALAAANSVDSAAIIDGTIVTPDLKNGALSGSKILDNAVTGADVNEASLAAVCPAGLTRVSDLCYGVPRTGDDWWAALNDCVDEKLRLPSVAEALQISVDIAGVGPNIWTNDIFADPAQTSYWAFRVWQDAGVLDAQMASESPYICMTSVGSRP